MTNIKSVSKNLIHFLLHACIEKANPKNHNPRAKHNAPSKVHAGAFVTHLYHNTKIKTLAHSTYSLITETFSIHTPSHRTAYPFVPLELVGKVYQNEIGHPFVRMRRVRCQTRVRGSRKVKPAPTAPLCNSAHSISLEKIIELKVIQSQIISKYVHMSKMEFVQ